MKKLTLINNRIRIIAAKNSLFAEEDPFVIVHADIIIREADAAAFVIGHILSENNAEGNALLDPVINQNLNPSKWATEDDLQALAAHFNVELELVYPGIHPGEVNTGKSIITLRNHGNAHWTTLIDPFRCADIDISKKTKQLACQYMPSEALTIREIKEMFTSYGGKTFGGFFSRLGRHHASVVTGILQKCDEQDVTPETILQYIRDNMPKPCDKTGDFYARVDYVSLRLEHKCYTPEPAASHETSATPSG